MNIIIGYLQNTGEVCNAAGKLAIYSAFPLVPYTSALLGQLWKRLEQSTCCVLSSRFYIFL
jgi:hypothetical protein